MITRIILWRHGQTDLNKQRRLQGASDYPLNETGREQAKAAAPRLAELGPHYIVSSPLVRARDTARELEALTGITAVEDARVAERSFGSWEGQNLEEIAEHSPERLTLWRDGKEPGGDVETREACGLRVAESINDWTEKLSGKGGNTLVVVAHGGAISNGVMTLLGTNPSERQPIAGLDNCHWAVLTRQDNRVPGWRLVSYNVN